MNFGVFEVFYQHFFEIRDTIILEDTLLLDELPLDLELPHLFELNFNRMGSLLS